MDLLLSALENAGIVFTSDVLLPYTIIAIVIILLNVLKTVRP